MKITVFDTRNTLKQDNSTIKTREIWQFWTRPLFDQVKVVQKFNFNYGG